MSFSLTKATTLYDFAASEYSIINLAAA